MAFPKKIYLIEGEEECWFASMKKVVDNVNSNNEDEAKVATYVLESEQKYGLELVPVMTKALKKK